MVIGAPTAAGGTNGASGAGCACSTLVSTSTCTPRIPDRSMTSRPAGACLATPCPPPFTDRSSECSRASRTARTTSTVDAAWTTTSGTWAIPPEEVPRRTLDTRSALGHRP